MLAILLATLIACIVVCAGSPNMSWMLNRTDRLFQWAAASKQRAEKSATPARNLADNSVLSASALSLVSEKHDENTMIQPGDS